MDSPLSLLQNDPYETEDQGLTSLLTSRAKEMAPQRAAVEERRTKLDEAAQRLIQAQQYRASPMRDPGLVQFGLEMMSGDGTESFGNSFARASKSRIGTDDAIRKAQQESAIAQATTGLKAAENSLGYLDTDQKNEIELLKLANSSDYQKLMRYMHESNKPKFLRQKDGTYLQVDPNTGDVVNTIGDGTIGNLKPLSQAAMNKLETQSTQYNQIKRLSEQFGDSFAGNLTDTTGEIENWIGQKMGDDTGRAQWWQDYQDYMNNVRHELFGASLTAPEKNEFLKAMVRPGMHPNEVRKNLKRQFGLAQKAVNRTANVYKKGGYSPEQIYEYINPEEVMDTTPSGLPSLPPSTKVTPDLKAKAQAILDARRKK